LVVENDPGHEEVHEIAHIEREGVEVETFGLTLAEGKLILKKIQEPVNTPMELAAELANHPAGDKIKIGFLIRSTAVS
jgi:hypothetical protein